VENMCSGKKDWKMKIAMVESATRDPCPSTQTGKQIGTENEDGALTNVKLGGLEFRCCC
jgi:hypothetical protein